MKKPEPLLPLQWIKRIGTIFPGCWDLCDIAVTNPDEIDWGDLCVIPIAATSTLVEQYIVSKAIAIDRMTESDILMPWSYSSLMAGLYAWRLHKEIYRFDKDFRDLLFDQADDIEIPIELLFRLPYPAICIDIGDDVNSKEALVWFEYDVNRGEYELRIELFTKEDFYPIILHLTPGTTVSESIEQAYLESTKSMNENLAGVLQGKYPHYISEQTTLVSRILQLIMYLCVDNAEVKENEEQKKITRRTDKPKDVYREIRKWDVGYRYGASIRKYKSAPASQSSGEHHEGSKKRPHTRRGHIHHFWIGSEKDNSRKIVAKWVAPMFINADDDDIIPTIHNIN